jgi:hypothetical protein
MKAISLRCKIGPKPKATIKDNVKAPETFPATVATAVARPQAIALAIMKSTLGPGARIITIAATKYSGYRAGKSNDIAEFYKQKKQRPDHF